MDVCELAIIGGGAIGLSLAYELAVRGRKVALFDRGELGREASWAGAGILPPAPTRGVLDPIDQLRRLAMELHPVLARRLAEETGIDTGFRECGAIYAAFSVGERASLVGLHNLNQEQGIESRLLSSDELAQIEPAINVNAIAGAIELPGEWQLRNPHHLRALEAACRQRGVLLRPDEEVGSLESASPEGWLLRTPRGVTRAERVCVAAGAWSPRLLASLGVECSVFPIRGQMVLYRSSRPLIRRIVNVGPRYLVPRDDGHLLVGSTEEEVGFDKSNTDKAIAELRDLAEALIPDLKYEQVVRTWAGLRPASFDSMPYMGEAPGHPGLYLASGHFRSGLYLSPAVARLMADLICGETPPIDLWPFRISRG